MIRLREITGDEPLLAAFVSHYERVGGFPLDIEYARRCRAYAFMDGATRMVGGFLLNMTPPFRALNDMPEEDRQRIMSLLDLDDTFEGMCIWLEPALRGSLQAVRPWAMALVTIWRIPRRNVLSCTVSRSLLRMYKRMPLEMLYEGKIHTPQRVLDKYVILSRKEGFLRGLMMEVMHRIWRSISAWYRAQHAGAVHPVHVK